MQSKFESSSIYLFVCSEFACVKDVRFEIKRILYLLPKFVGKYCATRVMAHGHFMSDWFLDVRIANHSSP